MINVKIMDRCQWEPMNSKVSSACVRLHCTTRTGVYKWKHWVMPAISFDHDVARSNFDRNSTGRP